MDKIDIVTISRKEYEDLKADSKFLSCLTACGVDNWDFYDDARDMMGDEE